MTTVTDPTIQTPTVPNSTSTTAQDNASLNMDYTQFLTLLTDQLKNQDPLSPMDTNQFTQQLVSMSGVEQQIKANDSLNKLVTQANNNQTTLGLSYIGLNVAVQSNQFDFNPSTDASVKVSYNLPSAASINTINILDQNGNTIYTTTGSLAAGTHNFTWDGTDQSGQPVAAGTYTLQVNALDSTQAPITAATQVPGYVTGIQTASDGSIELMIGKQSTQLVPLANVTQASL